jgi:hypothetical protein
MKFYDFNESTCPQDVPCQAGSFQNKLTVKNWLFFRQESNLAWTMRLWMPNWVCWRTKHLLLDHEVECFLHIGARPVGSARCYICNHGDWGTFSVPNEATLLCILRMERNLSTISPYQIFEWTFAHYPHFLPSYTSVQWASPASLERIINVEFQWSLGMPRCKNRCDDLRETWIHGHGSHDILSHTLYTPSQWNWSKGLCNKCFFSIYSCKRIKRKE